MATPAVIESSAGLRRITEGNGSDWPLVGRAVEAARVAATLAGSGTGEGSAGVVLVGSAGAGKTALARSCVQRAAGNGRPTLWLTGATGTVDIPLGAFATVLPELDGAGSPDQLLYQAARVIRARAGGRALVLAVDDGQWLDGLSAAPVARLVDDGHAVLVATVRAGTGVPGPLVDLWKNGRVRRLELEPLRREDVDELLTTALGGPVDIATSAEFLRVSDGNPLFLRELFLAARRGGLLRDDGGSWTLTGPLPTSGRLAELIETRLTGLDRPARDALELLAVAGELALEHVERVVSFEVLEELEAATLVTVRQDTCGSERIDLAHPLFGEVLRAGLPSLRTRRLRQILADSLESAGLPEEADLERVVRWRLEAALLHDAVRVHPPIAKHVADRLTELAAVVEGPLTAARAALAQALADDDSAAVEVAAREFEKLGALLYAAEAAQAGAGIAAAAGASRRATALRR